MMIRFVDCKSIRMRDITLHNPASWTSAWLYCADIVVDGITIESRVNNNGDGLDFDGCENVRVSNCFFNTSDDSICLQTSRVDRPCRNVAITNCLFTSKWAGIRIGLSSRADFENVTVSNCTFRDIEDSGLKIQMCEGAVMKNMLFSDLIMTNVPRPVFMTFGQQRAGNEAPLELAPMKSMGDMIFSNILVDNRAYGKDSSFIIVGLPGHPIENIVLDNIRFRSGGGGTLADAQPKQLPDLTPERIEQWWPEYYRFKRTVPSFGVYAGHVRGLTIRNSIFDVAKEDARPAIVCDDVDGLDISRVQIGAAASTEPLVFLYNTRNAELEGVRPTGAPRNTVNREGGD